MRGPKIQNTLLHSFVIRFVELRGRIAAEKGMRLVVALCFALSSPNMFVR